MYTYICHTRKSGPKIFFLPVPNTDTNIHTETLNCNFASCFLSWCTFCGCAIIRERGKCSCDMTIYIKIVFSVRVSSSVCIKGLCCAVTSQKGCKGVPNDESCLTNFFIEMSDLWETGYETVCTFVVVGMLGYSINFEWNNFCGFVSFCNNVSCLVYVGTCKRRNFDRNFIIYSFFVGEFFGMIFFDVEVWSSLTLKL